MKMTLLEIVQGILSDIDGDEVNSITDTTESLQVANAVKETYNHIVTKADLPERYGLFELDASVTSTKPVLMTVPSYVDNIKWLKYDCKTDTDPYPVFNYMDYQPLEMFLESMYNLPGQIDSTIETFDHTANFGTLSFYYYNDRAPSKYSSIDDTTLIFDAYDNTVDTTLQKSKTLGYGRILTTFLMQDTYVPQIDANMFPLLFQETKAQVMNDLRQMDSPRADKRAKEQWTKNQDIRENAGGRQPYQRKSWMPNYGRKA